MTYNPQANVFSPDAAPISPSAWDDEFNGTSLDAKWISQHTPAGGFTATVANGCLGLEDTGKTDTTTIGYVQGSLGSTWKVTCKVEVMNASSNKGAGLIVKDSVSGKQFWFMFTNEGGTPKLIIYRVTSGDSNDFSSSAFAETTFALPFVGYLQVERPGDTNIYFRWSRTGQQFLTVFISGETAFTTNAPDQVGPGYWGTATGTINAYFDWIRKS